MMSKFSVLSLGALFHIGLQTVCRLFLTGFRSLESPRERPSVCTSEFVYQLGPNQTDPRLSAIQNIGSLIAIPFAPYIADHFGRRTGIIVGCLCMFLATGLQAGAQNNGMFIAGRGLSE
jgi:MFS family permease